MWTRATMARQATKPRSSHLAIEELVAKYPIKNADKAKSTEIREAALLTGKGW
jgi:hypothetical protein